MNVLPRKGAPFTPALVPPRHFVGRVPEQALFESWLEALFNGGEQPPVMIVESRHGLGRSSFLRRARAIALRYGLTPRPCDSGTSWAWELRDEQTGRRIVLVDDADTLSDEALGNLVDGLIRVARAEGVSGGTLLLLMAGLPGLARRMGAIGRYPSLLTLPLGALSAEDAKTLLEVAPAEFYEAFLPDARDEIARRANGIPVFLQLRGETAWNLSPSSPITLDDVEALEPVSTARIIETFLEPALARATRAERAYLAAGAQAASPDGRFASGEAEARLQGARGIRPDGGLRRGLLAKGLLFSPARGELAFAHPGMREHLLGEVAP